MMNPKLTRAYFFNWCVCVKTPRFFFGVFLLGLEEMGSQVTGLGCWEYVGFFHGEGGVLNMVVIVMIVSKDPFVISP